MSHAASPPLLVSLDEAARQLAVSRRTAWELAARGDLATVKVGRLRRVAVADLERYVATRREAAGALGQP